MNKEELEALEKIEKRDAASIKRMWFAIFIFFVATVIQIFALFKN